ncbi:MAG: phosphoglucosamine mutase [Cryomorphaceae bacterium]|nr:MAG: phosphoglucosamine mutase [Cryomorphaceae bacterium]
MTLIKSISGIRGTIGGPVGDNLTPIDIVRFSAAYGQWLRKRHAGAPCKVVVGRDARKSGAMLSALVSATLQGMGIDVLDAGLSTTPTVEMAVVRERAQGGIILTASHNPGQWNALKLLNERGEFISGQDGADVLSLAEKEDFGFADVDALGTVTELEDAIEAHIDAIVQLPLVDTHTIANANLKVVVDAVNSTGGLALLPLLERLGVDEVIPMYCEPTGEFPHNPEPLPEHLTEISARVVESRADLGIVVDPDVDRLALICEDGTMFGEEYTLVAVADYVLSRQPGNTVSNLSSSRALRDVTRKYNQQYRAAAVGEVNVVEAMKHSNAVIGGEGNGGIIYPELHYGRDAMVGIALFLSYMARSGKAASELRKALPAYYMTKRKIELRPGMDVDALLITIKDSYKDLEPNTTDGVKIDFEDGWVHLRKSNTEPIIRIYSEGISESKAIQLADEIGRRIQAEIG